MGTTKKPSTPPGAKRPRSEKDGKGDKRDWVAIREEFVTKPTITIKELADRWGIPVDTVYQRSANEKWGDARQGFRQELGKKSREKIAARYAAAREENFGLVELGRDMLVEQLKNGQLTANSTEAAVKGITEAIKTMAAMAGDPIADKTEVNHTGNLNISVRRFKELTEDELDDLERGVQAGTARGAAGARVR